MRKISILIIIVFHSNNMIGQDFRYLSPELDDSCKIIRSISDSVEMFEQLIYIDYKRDSKDKRSIADFRLTDNRIDQINESYKWISTRCNKPLKKVNQNLPDKWIRIFKYKDEWILFDDIEFNNRYILSDSALISFDMDGIYANPLTDYKLEEDFYKFKYCAISWDDNQTTSEYKLDIRIIDAESMISIWRFNINESIYYDFMIPEKFKNRFPIIGILTTDLTGDESDILDVVDFEKIISNK
jgi:hypothetical protein